MACRRSPRSFRALVVATSLTATLLAGVASAPAGAATPAEDVAAAQATLAALTADEEAAASRLAGSAAAVGEVEQKLGTVEAEASAAQERLSAARSESGRLASAAYRQGGVITGALHLMLSDDGRLDADSSYLRARLQAQGGDVRRTEQEGAGLQAEREALAQQAQAAQAERDAAAGQHAAARTAVAEAARRLEALRAAERAAVEAARAEAAQTASRNAARTAAQAPRAAAAAPAPARAPESSAPAGPAPVAAGSCPPSGGRGAEARLTPATLQIMRCGLAAFPQIQTAGGWGTRGNATDHDDGRAVDFMIPSYRSSEGNALGWAVARWAASQPGVDYVMFDGKVWGSWASGRGWTSVGNRGSDTANHLDHVHVSVKG